MCNYVLVFLLLYSIVYNLYVGCLVEKVRVGNSEFVCIENFVVDNLMKY